MVTVQGRTPSLNGVVYSLSFNANYAFFTIISRMVHSRMCGGWFGGTSLDEAVLTMLGLDNIAGERAYGHHHASKRQKVRFGVPCGKVRICSVTRLYDSTRASRSVSVVILS